MTLDRVVRGACVVLALAGCKQPLNSAGEPKGVIARVKKEQRAERVPVLGERRVEGPVTELRASPDGEVLTVLRDAVKPPISGVPPPMRLGALWAVSASGGAAQKLGNGVTNMPGGWLHTGDSRWILFNAGWDPQQQVGELYVQDARQLGAERQRISARASYFVPSDDGTQVAFIEGGVLHAGKLPGGPFPQLAGEVSTAEFSADGRYLYFKRKFSSAGGLYQLDLKDERPQPRRLIDQVTEYTVLRSGKYVVALARETPVDRVFQLHLFEVATLKARKLAEDAHRFRASRDGRFLAWRDNDPGPEKGALYLMALPDGAPRKLGAKVSDFDFSPDGARFAWRDNFIELSLGGSESPLDDHKLVERVGDLHVLEMPDGEPKRLARQSPNYLFAPNSAALAYTARIDRPEVTRRLFLYPAGATEPIALKDWLYEYTFPATGEFLYFRSDCLRDGRACDLLSMPAKPATGELPKKELEGTFGVRFSPDGKRALVASAHITDMTHDISVRDLAKGTQVMIDQYVEWPGLLLGPEGAKVAYLVNEKNRPGLYVANSP